MKILLADDDPITLDALHACIAPEGFTALLARVSIDLSPREAGARCRLSLPPAAEVTPPDAPRIRR